MMNKLRNLFLAFSLVGSVVTQAQPYKYFYSNTVKFLKPGTNDSLLMPFTGGMNAAQVSNIDLNNDGLQDLFIFDRTGQKAMTFLRKGNSFEYTPSYDGQFPKLNDWALLNDYDGDGKQDIYSEVSLDRDDLVDTIQQVTISGLRILRNTSTGGKLKFKPVSNQIQDTGGVYMGTPIDPSNIFINYSDIAGIGDLDNDGDADVLAYVLANLMPSYFENYIKNKHHIPYTGDTSRFVWRDQCWGYFMYDRTYKTNSFELGLSRSQMSSCFFQMYEKHGGMHANNTLCVIDANGDGVKDLIYGDGSYNNLVLLVNGRAQNSLGRDSIASQDTLFPSNTTRANFIIFPVAYYVDIDGDGVKELIVTTNEPLSAKSKNNIWVYENTGTTAQPVFNYAGNKFVVYDETIDLGTRSAPALVDIDADGDEDIIVGTNGDFDQTHYAADHLVWYKNIGKVANRAVFQLADTNFLQLSKDTAVFSITPAFADMNDDGKKDMILGDMSGYLLYYLNTSSGGNISFALQTRTLGGIDAGSNASPAIYDMDNDGDFDLVVGTRNGFLRYYANTGTKSNPQFSSTPTIDSLGKVLTNRTYINQYNGKVTDVTGYAAPVLYDLDGDSKPELVVGSQNGKVYIYTDVSLTPGAVFTRYDKLFVDGSDSTFGKSITFGNQSRPAVGLLDEDNKPDILVGNIRGGLAFYGSKTDSKPVNPGGLEHLNGANSRVTAYPNPTRNAVTLAYHNLDKSGIYTVYNQIGQELMKGNVNAFHTECVVDLSSLAPGVYFIKVESGEYLQTLKVIRN